MNAFASRCHLLDNDIRQSGVDLDWAIVRTPSTVIWKSADAYEPDAETLRDFEDDEYLLTVDRNARVLSSVPDSDLLAEIAEALAEEVMDRLNRPWPELADGGVLEPVTKGEEIYWRHQYGNAVLIGDLGSIALR